jgi:hypothetical protein
MISRILKSPDHCDICKDNIKLYEPYDTVKADKIHCHVKVKGYDKLVLCTTCFTAYQNFIIERTVQENHKNTMNEMKGVKKK